MIFLCHFLLNSTPSRVSPSSFFFLILSNKLPPVCEMRESFCQVTHSNACAENPLFTWHVSHSYPARFSGSSCCKRSGFISAADLQRPNAFLHCSIHQGFCSLDLTDITVIFDAADETLFCKILSDRNHLLAPLLPNEVCTPCHLRPRRHNRQLTPKVNKL